MFFNKPFVTCLLTFCLSLTWAYSPSEDARIIAEYKESLNKMFHKTNVKSKRNEFDHAVVARKLVHGNNWAAMGTISSNAAIKDFPMVNVISINDNDGNGISTGHIQFLLTDLDFTGSDWQKNNKVTILLSEAEERNGCMTGFPNYETLDPMEPTCPRAIISGEIKKMDKNSPGYEIAVVSFVNRHPAAKNWLAAHAFYLCELDIKNIYVLDYYGGPHNIKPEDYYNAKI